MIHKCCVWLYQMQKKLNVAEPPPKVLSDCIKIDILINIITSPLQRRCCMVKYRIPVS